MKLSLPSHVGLILLFLCFRAFGATHYVSLSSTNPTALYTSWATAAANIQDAIDASANGDTVLVTNGIYDTGGILEPTGNTSNRVALTSAITVQSVNGPLVTTIQGFYAATGHTAVRCAWLTNNAALIGFTLTGGATINDAEPGGGVWCASTNSLVQNCVIVSNTASYQGTGVYSGTCNNCLISGNNSFGGPQTAVYQGNLNNCTVVNNNYFQLFAGPTVTNCIIYNNGGDAIGTAVKVGYTCTTPLPSGTGNFTNPPQLFVDNVHLLGTSPCISAGATPVTPADIFGNAWGNPPSIGCAQYQSGPLVAQPVISFTNSSGFDVNASVAGRQPMSLQWLLNGQPLQNVGPFSSVQTTNLVVSSGSMEEGGAYQLVASNAYGVVTSSIAPLVIHCVNEAGLNPVAPYLTWVTAATNIQDAITAANSGDMVLVTNGIYEYGAASGDGTTTNRVTLNKAISVQSVNGPFVTTILGGGATNSANTAIRCAWLTTNAALAGFRLADGTAASNGGGVWCASSNAYVFNCLIVSNASHSQGSGGYQGTYYNCLVSTNQGGDAVANASLNNCTIVSNTPGGVSNGKLTNCIVYYNYSIYPIVQQINVTATSVAGYCCSTPAPGGTSNFATAPLLAFDGAHLAAGSPCIGTGTNQTVGTDIFGMAWATPPSIGCAEYNPIPIINQPQITLSSSGFSISAALFGPGPFTLQWLENGVPLQNDMGFVSTQSSNLVATGLNLSDSGSYQWVVSNAFGVSTSAPVQLTVHVVDAAGGNPQPPFLTWATAATNIQEAIEASAPGDIVLVTNGIYDTGGVAEAGSLTNRVALDRPVLVISVNGWRYTVIEGVSFVGTNAVRCAWLTNGAILSGFTLQNGATQNAGNTTTMESGGGAWCASTNALVSNCVLSNNVAAYGGGGFAFGTLNNSLVVNNVADTFGAGAYNAALDNCTVLNNTLNSPSANGGGTSGSSVSNSIVLDNTDDSINLTDNYGFNQFGIYGLPLYAYSDSAGNVGTPPAGTGNISGNPLFMDAYHLSLYSPCRGAGSALSTTGTDLDGNPWNNPPSMGCSEVVPSTRVGPLSVTLNVQESVFPTQTNVLLGHYAIFTGTVTGLASYTSWSFGDGPLLTNTSFLNFHEWTNVGSYNVAFTAYNEDNPLGVSTNIVMQVSAPNPPQIQPPVVLTNGIQFGFVGQANAGYTVQYTTNLASPVSWTTLENIHLSPGGLTQITDAPPTNTARFYRVVAQ